MGPSCISISNSVLERVGSRDGTSFFSFEYRFLNIIPHKDMLLLRASKLFKTLSLEDRTLSHSSTLQFAQCIAFCVSLKYLGFVKKDKTFTRFREHHGP